MTTPQRPPPSTAGAPASPAQAPAVPGDECAPEADRPAPPRAACGRSPISNPGYDPATARRLPVERAWVCPPLDGWTFAHHPFIAHAAGRYVAMWSNGRRDEDAPGQRVLVATSRDGLEWDPPRALLGPLPGTAGELVLTAGGFHAHRGGLVAYVAQDEYLPEALAAGGRPFDGRGRVGRAVRALVSTDGGTWSAAGDLGLPMIPNHGPQALASGRLLMAGFIAFPSTADPSGLSGWRMAGFGTPQENAEHMDGPVSESGYRLKRRLGIASGLCEGAFLQADDGTVRMLLRSGEDRLWVSESCDDGATWTVPVPTGFTDNVSKFHLGRLPDGRFYYVGCPDPEPRWRRSPLVLSLSRDGIVFDRHFVIAESPYRRLHEGMHKIGDYGYPHTLVHADRLHVVVSRAKESVEVLRVPLGALAG